MRVSIVLRGVWNGVRRFSKAKRGNVAMIMGLSLVPICIAVGMGLDMSRAMITRARMGAALDAAGLAVGSQPSLTQDQMQSLAREYFKQNYTADVNQYGTPDEVTLTRPSGSQTITLSTQVQMPTVLMRVFGVDNMAVRATSQITWGQTKLWVALVLDNTGSMCEPGSQPCTNPLTTSKIYALKQATHNLLQMLQNAAANDGDVKVSIVPFSKDVNVGTTNVGASWIDWTDWEAEPSTSDQSDPKAPLTSSVGPGSNCPWTTSSNGRKSPYGYYCVSTAGSSTKVSKIPSSGLICPGVDGGNYNSGNGSTISDRASHYYNGCYDSVATQTLTTTKVSTTPITIKQSCNQTGSGSVNCSNKNGYPSSGTTTSNTTTATTNGYSGDSGPTQTTNTTTDSTSDGTKSCSGSGNNKYCTWTRTISQTQTVTTVTATGTNFTHTWHASDHSVWTGCVMDRSQDDDTENTAPSGSSKFPAENSDYCLPGTVTPLGYDWSTLSSQVDAMTANGNTNQTIGLAWGWQTLTNTDPYDPGSLPLDTRKVLILLTDGLNTQNRWSGSQSSIDARTSAVCSNIKNDNITVYTVQVNTGGDPLSTILQNCATDTSKYFELLHAGDIVNTFQQIGTQITNLRVSL